MNMVQQPLISIGRQRPEMHSEEIRRKAAEQLYEALERYSQEFVSASAEDRERDIQVFTEEIRFGLDGFEFAKTLADEHYWSLDAQMVEILDDATHLLCAAHRAAVERWVAEWKISTDLKVGDKVLQVGEAWRGEIVGLDEKMAEATVFVEAMGHVRTGSGTHGLIVHWEKLEKVADSRKQASD